MLALGACAAGPQLVDHAFGFDVLNDSPDVILIDYRCSTSRHPGALPPGWSLKDGSVRQQAGVNGETIVGDTQYVKWRIKPRLRLWKTPLT